MFVEKVKKRMKVTVIANGLIPVPSKSFNTERIDEIKRDFWVKCQRIYYKAAKKIIR
jgi:hypothetical protein